MPPDQRLARIPWAGDGDPGYLLRPSPDSEHFFAELNEGRFVLRYCPSCGRPRYPHAPVCPYCRTVGHEWRPAANHGTVLSWVRCHLAFVPEFASLVPYVVLDVQMEAGIRMIGRLVSETGEPSLDEAIEPSTGMKVRLAAEVWPGGVAVPSFVTASEGA